MEKRRVLQLFRSARHPLPNSLKHPIMELNTNLCKDGCDRKEGKTMSKVKRSFRKGLCVIMVGLLLVALVGCGAVAKPESMVSKYCDALKAFDMESAATCFASGDANIENPYTEEAAETQYPIYSRRSIRKMISGTDPAMPHPGSGGSAAACRRCAAPAPWS